MGVGAAEPRPQLKGERVSTISAARQLAISEWINDQFETAEPTELGRRPSDVDDYPSWQSDPASGLTGTVYLAEHTVYYYAPDTPPRSGWWDMGPLPAALRDADDD
jgi:hypothetical protein